MALRSVAIVPIFLVLGCSSDPEAPPTPGADGAPAAGEDGGSPLIPQKPSGDCAAQLTLAPDGGIVASETIDPLAIGTAPLFICLTLDTSLLPVRSHFVAATSNQEGDESSFALALFDDEGNLLRQGWDVVYGGSSDQSVHAHLEHTFPVGEVIEATVSISAVDESATALTVSLFEPYE